MFSIVLYGEPFITNELVKRIEKYKEELLNFYLFDSDVSNTKRLPRVKKMRVFEEIKRVNKWLEDHPIVK